MKQRFIKLVEKITGLKNNNKLPFGQSPYNDLRLRFRNYSFDLFFDIGAHTGQSISNIRKYFSDAEIWSFEPILSTYNILTKNIPDNKVNCFQLGFGAEKSEVEIYIDRERSDMASINNSKDNEKLSLNKETIRISTLDSFCDEHKIKNIDYVKIDTEGYDLEVLKGATNLLQSDRISFIETEVGMNPENTFHVRFEDIKQYLEKLDYRLYGIYEQVQEWPTNKPILRRVNALFIAKTIYDTK